MIKEENKDIEGKDELGTVEEGDKEISEGCCLCRMVCEICGCIFYCERIVLDKKLAENKDGKNLIEVKEENKQIELTTLENNKEKSNHKKEISDI